MKRKIKTDAEERASVKKLVQEIAKEQQKIDRHDGDIVVSHIRIGRHLADLRPLAKKTWGKQLKAIGINPRVASRYLKIAANWPDETGLSESDLLARLPADLMKLEWLCRVPGPQLKGLLDDLDCKKAARPQVIAAVRAVLGEDPPARNVGDVEEFVDRFIARITKTVEGLGETFPEADQQDRARQLMAARLKRVEEALKAGHAVAAAS